MSHPHQTIYHMGGKVSPEGNVSALCYDPPRAIDLKKESWVLRPRAVTCQKCKAIMKANRASTTR